MTKHKFNRGREFTGAYDMNHRKIYLGDFVEYSNTAPITSIEHRSVVLKQGGVYTYQVEAGRTELEVGKDQYYVLNLGDPTRPHFDKELFKSEPPFLYVDLTGLNIFGVGGDTHD